MYKKMNELLRNGRQPFPGTLVHRYTHVAAAKTARFLLHFTIPTVL